MKVVLIRGDIVHSELMELLQEAGHEASVYFHEDFERFDSLDTRQQAEIEEIMAGCGLVVDGNPHGISIPMEAVERLLPDGKPYLIIALDASVSYLASGGDHPERIVGWSAMPPIVDKDGKGIIEVARGLQPRISISIQPVEFWQSLGLETVEVADGPGLVRGAGVVWFD